MTAKRRSSKNSPDPDVSLDPVVEVQGASGSVGGPVTDEGGRPVTDAGGRILNLDTPAPEELEND